ncbi:hypothetical protein C1645_837834 [Glomus cerebriforme]|uniref:Uncharacterized protein n=1 Tax=Glomus cerebriforme TaxID=658196 RepID=A0A397SDU6_9GLOM|nr:hypothetical protein C1645_837834 [Glomus cerebriforme]
MPFLLEKLEKDVVKRAELYKKCDIHAKKYREDRVIKTKEFYKKYKNDYPELKELIERELKEEERKNLEQFITTMINAQEYLETNYPKEDRKKIEVMDISNELLEDFLKNLNHETLEILEVLNNNFSEQYLSFLSKFVNLKELSIANNRFTGSLEPLKNMNKLEVLNNKPGSRVKKISQELKKHGKPETNEPRRIEETLEKTTQTNSTTEEIKAGVLEKPNFVNININNNIFSPTNNNVQQTITNLDPKQTPPKETTADNDELAVDYLKENFSSLQVIQKNALTNFKRTDYGISEKQKLIIIGNPPYNDLTSLKGRKIKQNSRNNLTIDSQIKSRDLGISFLRSYYHLKADYVCILHPLSYLIKETNFNHLKEFKDNYRLLKSLVIDSKKFTDAKGASFPIAISLYQKDKKGMDYEYIKNFSFQLEDGREFSLNSFQFLTNLVNKYPKKTFSDEYLNNLFFFTFRDINSIMRNRTFISKVNQYSVPIEKNKLKYYAYIDYFKEEFQAKIPFYLRNMDVFYNPNFQEED